jgi:alpha-amylase/alpha-mannosidase (GH57 family)
MRYICIHNHFYQPPRENPWLEAVELQDSAYPYHDWNERVTSECYAPNAAARILNSENLITDIVNNYEWISFNFGPTLFSWLQVYAPKIYEAILDADKKSRERFSGHGSAIAQAYNHVILPLANRRDKSTQVIWGMRDFERRFSRRPEGMWLPETAVDLETLDVLAQRGIKFSIVAPRQAKRVRRIGTRNWRDVNGEQIDPTMAYRVRLPSRRSINLFFYDGPISRGIAFEGLLNNGEHFAKRLLGAFSDQRTWPELVHVATDGETYGHHHRHGEMALSYALEYIQAKKTADITNYGEYLERHPPTHEVEIIENTSWSCVHGIERWRTDCGCNAGHPGWNQSWRAPLREGLDGLRDTLAPWFEQQARSFFQDPWAARDGYIDLVLDRSPESIVSFFSRYARRELSTDDEVAALKLLELQRHLMLMYTSCGWFFDELSGLETVQVIQYAGRAVQLAQGLFGDGIEETFLQALVKAKSNIPEHQDGASIYRKFVKPAVVNLEKVAAHYAVSSLFRPYPDRASIYCYTAERECFRSLEAGRMKLAMGYGRYTSEITRETERLMFCALHFGDHNLVCGIRAFPGEEIYQGLAQEIEKFFSKADIPEVLRVMDKEFGSTTYSLKSLFRDDQRSILRQILSPSLEEGETAYRQIYEHHAPLIHFLRDLGMPLPKAILTATEFALNSRLRHEFGREDMDLERVQNLLEEARVAGIMLDFTTLEYTMRMTIERLFEKFTRFPRDLALLERLEKTVAQARSLPFEVSMWTAQNIWCQMHQTSYGDLAQRGEQGEPDAQAWVQHFNSIGEKLAIGISKRLFASRERAEAGDDKSG